MIKVKAVSISAICGFVLSFIFGLFSHSKFYMVLFKALIFALIFGAIGVLVSFLYEKFLAGDGSSEFSSDQGADASGSVSPVKGQKVNLVVEDQEFERGDSDNHFVVGENHQMLNDNDIAKSSRDNVQTQEFVPLRKKETVENISGKEAVVSSGQPENISNVDNRKSSVESSSAIPTLGEEHTEDIDVLPDMDNLSMASDVITATESENDDSEAGIDSDSGFSSVSSRRKQNEETEIQDAGLMAKAISSLLSEEK